VGSRLTIYENDDLKNALNLHFHLILHAKLSSYAVFEAMRRAVMRKAGKQEESKWSSNDMDKVCGHLSRICVCTTGGLGLTAEIPLKEGAVSAALGDHHTAL
jgi:hypothetical protein